MEDSIDTIIESHITKKRIDLPYTEYHLQNPKALKDAIIKKISDDDLPFPFPPEFCNEEFKTKTFN